MLTNAERASVLERALRASVEGDSSVVKRLFTYDVEGWSPGLHVTSAAELAVEMEDRDDAFTDLEFDVRSLDVGGDRACAEWTATATHSGPRVVDDGLAIEPTGLRCCVHGVTVAEFEGDRIRSFRVYWDQAESLDPVGPASHELIDQDPNQPKGDK